jgi:vacuolar-type H+-ATPase subunit E/Vma4
MSDRRLRTESMSEDHKRNEDSPIIRGIRAQAEQEAENIVRQARESAENRLEAMNRQAQREREEIAREADEKKEQILSTARSTYEIQERRRRLMMQEKITSQVISRARELIEEMIGTEQYSSVLEQLITEAAAGINTDQAYIRTSAREKVLIDEAMIARVQQRIQELTGKTIDLHISDAQPLQAQGVILSSEDGSVSLSNLIVDRMRRMNSEIRRRIHRQLFRNDREQD